MKLHRELVRRAKAEGKTLTDYVRTLLEREVARPPKREVFARIRARAPVDLQISAAGLIREGRDEQELRWDRLSPTRRPS